MPTYAVRINGRTHQIEGEPGDRLLSVLRFEAQSEERLAEVKREVEDVVRQATAAAQSEGAA